MGSLMGLSKQNLKRSLFRSGKVVILNVVKNKVLERSERFLF